MLFQFAPPSRLKIAPMSPLRPVQTPCGRLRPQASVSLSRNGRISAAAIWSGGTLTGAILGNVLPEIITNALGVALYGMFIAIVIPAARDSRPVLFAAAVSIAVSMILRYIPLFAGISGGFAIIICALTASALAAVLYPVEEESA